MPKQFIFLLACYAICLGLPACEPSKEPSSHVQEIEKTTEIISSKRENCQYEAYQDIDVFTLQGKEKIDTLSPIKPPYYFEFCYQKDSLKMFRVVCSEDGTTWKNWQICYLKGKKFVFFPDNTHAEMYGPNCVTYIFSTQDSLVKLFYNNDIMEKYSNASLIEIDIFHNMRLHTYGYDGIHSKTTDRNITPIYVAENLSNLLKGSTWTRTFETEYTETQGYILKKRKSTMPADAFPSKNPYYPTDSISFAKKGMSKNVCLFSLIY